jgi:hypothetical protein
VVALEAGLVALVAVVRGDVIADVTQISSTEMRPVSQFWRDGTAPDPFSVHVFLPFALVQMVVEVVVGAFVVVVVVVVGLVVAVDRQ